MMAQSYEPRHEKTVSPTICDISSKTSVGYDKLTHSMEDVTERVVEEPLLSIFVANCCKTHCNHGMMSREIPTPNESLVGKRVTNEKRKCPNTLMEEINMERC